MTRKINSEEVASSLKSEGFKGQSSPLHTLTPPHLHTLPPPVGLLHGDMTQGDRDDVITAFKRKELPILVATDVAGGFPHTLTPSHPHTLTPSHPHTLTPSHPHTLTSLTPSQPSLPSHPHTLTPSLASHPHILTPSPASLPSHPHILTSSLLHYSPWIPPGVPTFLCYHHPHTLTPSHSSRPRHPSYQDGGQL